VILVELHTVGRGLTCRSRKAYYIGSCDLWVKSYSIKCNTREKCDLYWVAYRWKGVDLQIKKSLLYMFLGHLGFLIMPFWRIQKCNLSYHISFERFWTNRQETSTCTVMWPSDKKIFKKCTFAITEASNRTLLEWVTQGWRKTNVTGFCDLQMKGFWKNTVWQNQKRHPIMYRLKCLYLRINKKPLVDGLWPIGQKL
jgi:hypothetical protein